MVGDKKGIGIVNINMRPYYVEGSKTLAYEVAEQMDWQVPESLIIPVGSGAMLNAICKGFEELHSLGLIDSPKNMKVVAAQPRGCAPIVDAFKRNSDEVIPVERPETIAKSLAIGDPRRRYLCFEKAKAVQWACRRGKRSGDRRRHYAALLRQRVFSPSLQAACQLQYLRKLVEESKIDKDERIVCYVTGNGLKATEAIIGILPKLNAIKPDTAEVSAIIR